MQAVILVGGMGTRLGDVVRTTPKPLLEVCDRPFVEHLMLNLRRFGFDEFILLAGYKADVVVDYYGPDSSFQQELGAQIKVVLEPEPMGTAGALKQAQPFLDDEFMLLNGDSIFDFNYLDLSQCCPPGEPEDWLVRVALLKVEDASRYGLVEVKGARIVAFREKPKESLPGVVNSGVYWVRSEILKYIDKLPCSLEQDVFPRITAEDGRVVGRVYKGFFIDIGIPSDLEDARANLTMHLRRPAAFLDRDGTLNYDDGYTYQIDSFRWIEGAKHAIKSLNDAGYLVFVVTNQAGIARGFYEAPDVELLHSWMQQELYPIGAHIDEFRYCPHHPDGVIESLSVTCECRKPGPGMLESLISRWHPKLKSSFMLGDKNKDVEAGLQVGLVSELVETGLIAGAVSKKLEETECETGD